MATLDETNIFGLPLKRQYGLEPEQKAPISEAEQASRQEYEQLIGSDNRLGLTFEGFLKAKERKKVSDQRKAVAQALTEGDTTKAYEGFTELPMVTDQLPAYMTPVLGNIIDEKERRYFGEKAGREFKDPRDIELEMLMASDPRDVKQYTEQDPVAGAMSTLAGASSLIGIGEGPSLAKAGIMGMFPSLRKGMTAKTMDGQGGGSGGISDIPPEPKKDYAGFVSSVEKVALGPQKFGSGQDLINFIESPKRSGISKKELEYIDFDQIRNNPDLTKEDVVKYIQDNRPNIYRVERVEDNPTYGGGAELDQNELSALPYSEARSNDINAEEARHYYDEYLSELNTQKSFIEENDTLKNNNYVLDKKTLAQDPDAKNALKNYLGRTSDAHFYLRREPIIRINYSNGEVAEFDINQIDDNEFFKQVIRTVDEDGAEVTFPLMTKNVEELASRASENVVSPNFGGGTDVYEDVGESGTNYQIIGSDENGYQVIIDGERTGNPEDYYNDLVDARGRIESEAFERGDIKQSADSFDNPYTDDQLIDIAPYEVITGEATLPTKFGYQYGDYRLPMGGADNYREFTLHIANPKTATRYSDEQGIKHFGGGDELLHYRTTDRIDEDGKKVLFVEEIQSDLHSTASSTRQSENYEIGPDTKKQAVKELKDIFKDNKKLRVADNGDIIKLDADSTYDTTNMLTAEEVSNVNTFENLTNFGSNINLRKMTILSDAEVKGLKKFREKYAKDEQVIPDYPYKGNAYIELAVKDIMKLASEGDYDRVAFTNPATQLRRNNKDLEYIDEIEINKVPKLTEAEQQFNENWMRNRDRSMVSQMQPEGVTGFDKIRIDGPLADADLNSFVGTHTDFVVNDPQANKLWQDFHKSENLKRSKNMEDYEEAHNKNSVGSIFARYDSPPTPSKLAEDLYQSEIEKAKLNHLKTLKSVVKNSADQDVRRLDLYKELRSKIDESVEGADASSDVGVLDTVRKHALNEIEVQQGRPYSEVTLENIILPESIVQKINQDVRRGISGIMRRFYDHTLPNVEDAGRYIVKQKGTGYKIDNSKFMVERGDITEGYRDTKFDTIDEMIKELRLNKNLQERIRNDVQKGNIPASTIDSQIYKVEAEGGSGKKPLDMYAKIIPQQVEKFAKKYDKNAKPQLKNVLYTYNEDLSPRDLYTDFSVEQTKLREQGQNLIKNKKVDNYDPENGIDFEAHESVSIDITPEMRKAILTEGVNVMYKGGIVNKVKSMDKPIQGNRREI